MDGPSVEHSDSDSGESWTLLENNSVYADEAPEFIEEQAKHEAQHHERDEDTDGISIISDSDHDTPTPPPPDNATFDKCNLGENHQTENEIPEYIPVTPDLPNINNNDQGAVASEEFLGDTHVKHKTYVHRRNKRLSTVLNIIVLGSVITAAGVAIGHMWGAKYDCTMQTTSSVNKILSNLYKLQEENAYLRGKLKELTFHNNNQVHQKMQPKYNKCKRVFEESLNNNDPKRVTKCVDDTYKTFDNLKEHLVKPKFEKEFVADIGKLKNVYLQNKSWLDDEISRRMKIEEELLKKYNNEVNSAKEQKKDPIGQKSDGNPVYSNMKDRKAEKSDRFVNYGNPDTDHLPKKAIYADSLQTDQNTKSKGEGQKFVKEENNDWLNSEHNLNNFDSIKHDFTSNEKSSSDPNDDRFISDFVETAHNNNKKDHYIVNDNWTEVKPKSRRNEERYEADYDKSSETKQKSNSKVQQKSKNDHTGDNPKIFNENRYANDGNTWSKRAQEEKNKVKKDKRNSKESAHSWKNDSNENRVPENFASEEDFIKDDRYVVNKLKQEKKKNGYVNSNKKQKRKSKLEKWNTKGEFGEKIDESSKVLVSKYPRNSHLNFDHVSFSNNIDDFDAITGTYKDIEGKFETVTGNMEKVEKKTDNVGQADWFEKRAVFRREARNKYYEQFTETSPNNSSWYFRRMRKREQCRAKGDNGTFKKIYKEKKNYKTKQ